MNILKILNKLDTDNIKMDSTNLMQELIDDGQYFTDASNHCSWSCKCSNTILERHKYLDLISKYKGKIIDAHEFKKIIEEYKLKFVIIVDEQKKYALGKYSINRVDSHFLCDTNKDDGIWDLCAGQDIFIYDITQSRPHFNFMKNSRNYICDVELSIYSKIEIVSDILKINMFIRTNERKITKYELLNTIFDNQTHDYMYIDNNIVDCSMCIKKSYKEHRENKQIMNGQKFKNKNLKYISFDKLNIIDISNEFKEQSDNVVKFIEISDFMHILHIALEKNIKMVDFRNDYIYDVEIQDDAQISRLASLYVCDNTMNKIKLTNERRLIDDLLLLSYLYYDSFDYYSCINKQEFNNIFFRNILGYFYVDILSVKIKKMIDLFFNSRAYLLDLEKVKQGWNDTYINIAVYIQSLFNTEDEIMRDECERQCIEFIKSLLDTITNRKHILIKKFSDTELKHLRVQIILCIPFETLNESKQLSLFQMIYKYIF